MDDCTTFDALLVDWLYDELEPAEAARFTRHIDGCDACWHTAEAMTRIRSLMRELPDEPPPEAASARILHQAGEQVAGARRHGLWAWLAGSLQVAWAHPAAAALATMLVVAGVAGALFTRGQFEMAAPATSASAEGAQLPASDAPAAGDETRPAAAPPAPAREIAQPSEKFAAELGEAEEQPSRVSGTRGNVRRDGAAAEPESSKRIARTGPGAAPDLRRAPAALAMDPELVAESDPTQERQAAPDSDDARDRVGAAASLGAGRAAGGMAASTPQGTPGVRPGDEATATPTTAANTRSGSTPAPRNDPKIDDKSERAPPRQEARKRDDRTWAETMHEALRTALRQEECARAVRIAEDIRAREPGYYRTLIANSKELAACRQPVESQGQAGKNSANRAD